MLSHYIIPRFKTLLTLGCVVLFCTFYWDVLTFYRLHNTRRPLFNHSSKDNETLDWSWICDEKTEVCSRALIDPHSKAALSFATCSMICSPGSNIWPSPTGDVKIKNTSSSFQTRNLKINFVPVKSLELSVLLTKTVKLYQERISKLARKSHAHSTVREVVVMVNVTKPDNNYKYSINIDESYKLIVAQKNSTVRVDVKASSFLGARHGLETLTQLIWWNDRHGVLNIMNSAVVTDAPIFSYRGFLLDTGRSFIPVPYILRAIDAVAMCKINVFHWHLTDSKSFPFASEKFSEFSKYGAYSRKEIYTSSDIKEVVEYAEVRGVTVLVEIDAPAHSSQGWGWGERNNQGNLSLCLDAQPFSEFCSEPPCGHLNPANENAYSVLVGVLKELFSLAKSGNLIHIGGDNVDFKCWESYGEVTDMDAYMNKGVVGVWELFYEKFLKTLNKEKILPDNFIIWSNDLVEGSDYWDNSKHARPIVQSRGPSTSGELERLVKRKFRVVVSSSDFWSLGEPQPWLSLYMYRPWTELSLKEQKLVVGGEVCTWTDHLDRHSLETDICPTVAVVAERLWSDPASTMNPMDRLVRLRERVLELGLSCSPLGPRWCALNPYQCL